MLKIDVLPGDVINEVIENALSLAKEQKRTVFFKFNTLPFYIHTDSNFKELKDYYHLSCKYGKVFR